MKRFRGGLVIKAHRLLYHSTQRYRVIKKRGRRQSTSFEPKPQNPKPGGSSRRGRIVLYCELTTDNFRKYTINNFPELMIDNFRSIVNFRAQTTKPDTRVMFTPGTYRSGSAINFAAGTVKSDTRNPEPDTQCPRTWNPEPGTPNPEPRTRNPEPGTRNPEPRTLCPKPSILTPNPKP